MLGTDKLKNDKSDKVYFYFPRFLSKNNHRKAELTKFQGLVDVLLVLHILTTVT
jgi:hypothetical protein